MAELWVSGVAALAALLSMPTAAAAVERQPGDVSYYCRVRHQFQLPGFDGSVPMQAERHGEQVTVRPAPGLELIDASISVDEKGGALSDLSLSWVQAGLGGWPYVWRTDLHPIYMVATFHEPGVVPAGGSNFDPAKLLIKIEVLSQRKIRHPLFLRLWREGQDKWLLSLGGPADIPAWRKSAQVTISWADLADYAKGRKQLHYELARPRPLATNSAERIVSEGRLDLSNLPRLFDEFRAAERKLMANVADRRDCQRTVEPEPTGDEEI